MITMKNDTKMASITLIEAKNRFGMSEQLEMD